MIRITSIIFLLLNITAFSQSGSLYTSMGIGDVQYSYSARRAGMGGLGVSLADDNFINNLNPAGWHKIKSTRIEFAAYYNAMFISDDAANGFYGEMEFSGVTMAFPISQLYGITASAGLVPVTNVSYEVKQSFTSPQNYEVTSSGSGGLSKMYLGTSYKLPFGLVVGANMDYYFGNIIYKAGIDFTNSSSLSSEYETRYNPKGIGGTFGFISPDLSSLIDTSAVTELNIGASVSYFGSLDFDTTIISRSNRVDTLSSGKGSIDIPLRFTAGANVILNNKYMISFDYAMQPWSEFKINDAAQSNLRNAQRFSLGFEYRPEAELGSTFWEQIIWRSGLSFEQTQYMINNEGINQYSITGGFSLPISFGNTLDIGVQYSMRGSSEPGLIKENTIRLNAGISFGEIWFVRQSY